MSRRRMEPVEIDDIDRLIINETQGGFPISETPFADVADRLGLAEDDLITRVKHLRKSGVLSRFGPMYHAERMGGGLTLAAIAVPDNYDFDAVAEQVNAFPEVAHNYARECVYNMWFVLATETPEGVAETIKAIKEKTGLEVKNMPKEEEFFIGLRFEA